MSSGESAGLKLGLGFDDDSGAARLADIGGPTEREVHQGGTVSGSHLDPAFQCPAHADLDGGYGRLGSILLDREGGFAPRDFPHEHWPSFRGRSKAG